MVDDARTDLAALLAGPLVPAARGLLNCTLSAGGVTVRLTEVEAYAGTGGDAARTRTEVVRPATR